jgi:DNA-binding transcriptional LysR family regulator
MMDRFQALEIFTAVADQGSFAAASRALRLSPPAITRGIAALEAHLGVPLFHRSTRTVSMTDQGAGVLDRARRLLADLADFERTARGTMSAPQGQLHVTAPVVFGRLHVVPVVSALLERYPDLSIQLMLIDRNVRIIEEGIDVAVRIGPLADSALKSLTIGHVRQVIVASGEYLARHKAPKTPTDLIDHKIIATTGPRAAGEWRFGDRRKSKVKVKPCLLTNTVESAIAAAENGCGIANFLSYQVDDALRCGRLFELFASEQAKPLPVSLLFPDNRSGLPAVRAFIEAMQQKMGETGIGSGA